MYVFTFTATQCSNTSLIVFAVDSKRVGERTAVQHSAAGALCRLRYQLAQPAHSASLYVLRVAVSAHRLTTRGLVDHTVGAVHPWNTAARLRRRHSIYGA